MAKQLKSKMKLKDTKIDEKWMKFDYYSKYTKWHYMYT